jgi:hypothetical protein
MFKTWVEIFLGKIGKYIIDFITSYYYFIIPPIIAYGIFLTLASFNLKRIEKSVNQVIIDQARVIMAREKRISYVELKDRINIGWDRIIRQRSFFPYVSQESDLWVSRTSRENVRDIIMHNDAKIRLVLERNGVFLISRRPDVRENLYTEFIHRITRRK